MQNEDFAEALLWYDHSLSLYGSLERDSPDVGKLHRNRASCYVALCDAEKVRARVCSSRARVRRAVRADQIARNCKQCCVHAFTCMTWILMQRVSASMFASCANDNDVL